jgi:membrane protease YdiL (CAAX protease family)
VKPLGRWRVHPAWYLIALVGPFLVTGLSGVVAVLMGAPSPGWGVYSDLSGLATTIVATMLVVGLFEEPGWRGYALPRMQRGHSALWAALVLGVVWALWHLPEMVGDPGEREPIPYSLSVVAQSVLLAWIYNSTRGSLLLVVLFHGAVNTAAKFLLPEFDGASRLIVWWS